MLEFIYMLLSEYVSFLNKKTNYIWNNTTVVWELVKHKD